MPPRRPFKARRLSGEMAGVRIRSAVIYAGGINRDGRPGLSASTGGQKFKESVCEHNFGGVFRRLALRRWQSKMERKRVEMNGVKEVTLDGYVCEQERRHELGAQEAGCGVGQICRRQCERRRRAIVREGA